MGLEKVGDFYVHVVHDPSFIDTKLTSSNKLLSTTGKPTVMHFYDGGCGGCRPCAAQMEHWAKNIPEAQFVCVCVESKQVAVAFHHMFDFDRVVNCYIPSRNYFPVGYGQLGCSGFIVSDKDGYFVSRKTSAFLQYGEQAFEHLEKILSNLIPLDANDEPAPSSSSNDTESTPRNGKIDLPASVGVDSMDDEHKECTDAFNKVIGNPSSCNMQELFDTLKSHFAHEEDIMMKFAEESKTESKTDNSSSFSFLTSHKMDHGRILNLAEKELGRVTAGKVLRGKCHEESANLDVIYKIADEFHLHADRFDALYEAKVPRWAK